MRIEMTSEQAQEVEALLTEALADMSHEIAATDNPAYRTKLVTRRRRLTEVAESVRALLPATEPVGDAVGLEREMAHPGG